MIAPIKHQEIIQHILCCFKSIYTNVRTSHHKWGLVQGLERKLSFRSQTEATTHPRLFVAKPARKWLFYSNGFLWKSWNSPIFTPWYSSFYIFQHMEYLYYSLKTRKIPSRYKIQNNICCPARFKMQASGKVYQLYGNMVIRFTNYSLRHYKL